MFTENVPMKKMPLSLIITLTAFFAAAALFTLLLPFRADGFYTANQTEIKKPYLLTVGAQSAVININSSGYYTLCNIPYIGDKASDIQALRSELGSFASIEQLSLINGIGLKTYLKAAAYVRAD